MILSIIKKYYLHQIAGITTLILLLYFGKFFWDWEKMTNPIPAGISIDETIYVSYHTKMWYSCGVGIFKLNKKTIQQINNDGLSFLKLHTTGQDFEKYQRSRDEYIWTKSPIKTLQGTPAEGVFPAWCVDIDPKLLNEINSELKGNDSFYTEPNPDFRLYILPKLGILVSSAYIQ